MYTNEIARTKKRKKTLIILSLVFVAGVFAGLALDRVAFCFDVEKREKTTSSEKKMETPSKSTGNASNSSAAQKNVSKEPKNPEKQNGSSSQTVQTSGYRRPEKGKWILIDKGTHKLYVMDGKNPKPIETYGVATGKNHGNKTKSGDFRTPEGDDFYVQSVQDASTWSHDFHDGKGVIKNAYGPWFIRLHTGWNGIGIHGTHDPKSIGKDATEGCIRLKNTDVHELKKYIKSGMKIVIVRNGKITPPAKSTTQDSGPRESNKERTEDKKKKGSQDRGVHQLLALKATQTKLANF